MTRLARIHPYPAMVADSLADYVATAFIKEGHRVADPFAGTGRFLLAAAPRASLCVGVDINPLAHLISLAKVARVRASALQRILDRAAGLKPRYSSIDLTPGRLVVWFSAHVRQELVELIRLINKSELTHDEIVLLAVILSATARETSWVRQDSWKLHRLSPRERRRKRRSAIAVFRRRLRSCLGELGRSSFPSAQMSFIEGDSRRFRELLRAHGQSAAFDVICTSPPYGDSVSTVQYGGISGLCLGMLKHLNKLSFSTVCSGAIDRMCLGGSRRLSHDLGRVWNGAARFAPQVAGFVADIKASCREIALSLRIGGTALLLVGNRSVGGAELALDRLVIESLGEQGINFSGRMIRTIANKTNPHSVNTSGVRQRRGRSVPTMHQEALLAFQRRR